MPVESFLFRLDKYKSDQDVEALQEVFGLPGKYALLELWGYVMRSDKWPLFEARIHLAAFRRTMSLDDDGTALGIIRMLGELKPDAVEFHTTEIFTFRYPRLFNYLGRYGQRKACEFFGLDLKDAEIPKTCEEYWEVLGKFGKIPESLGKIGKVSQGQVSLGVGVGVGSDQESDQSKRSDLQKPTFKTAASSSNPSGPPPLEGGERLTEMWLQSVHRFSGAPNTSVFSTPTVTVVKTQRVFDGLLAEGWAQERLKAQIAAIADPRNWWAGKIKRASTFARKLTEGIDFVARLDEEIKKNGGKAQKTDDHEAEKQAREGQDGAFGH